MFLRIFNILIPLIFIVSCWGTREIDYPTSESYQGEYISDKERIGIASWYGHKEHGGKTASGERFDRYAHTAAHKTLPFGTMVKVTNLTNGKDTVVEINDRGPFVKNRIIDLSYAAAKSIGLIGRGTARVRIEVLSTPSKRNYSIFSPVYTVQIGSFSHKKNAENIKRDLNNRDYDDVRVETIKIKGSEYYRVRVGMFAERRNAETIRSKLRKNGYRGTIFME